MMIPTIPLHYGHTDQIWPLGSCWLIEHARAEGPRLYWMDVTRDEWCTGWSYLPCHAAGFATKVDALAAYAQRGRTAVEGGTIDAFEHMWGDAE